MPNEAKRRISAILGATVADAASLPLEWIYKGDTMKEIVGDKNPEFWPESKCPFFTVPTGSLSCYGDELATTLSSLAATDGNLDVVDVEDKIIKTFGAEDSPYQKALAKRADKVYPVPGPWINSGVIKSLANMKEKVKPPGSQDCEDNDGLAVSLPAFLVKQCHCQTKEIANLITTNQETISHLMVQTSIVGHSLQGDEAPIDKAVIDCAKEQPEVIKEINKVKNAVLEGKSLDDIVEQFGKACNLPGSFQGAVAVILTSDSFVSAVRSNILAGGDSNGRSILVGATMGAKLGVEAIPMEWIEKVSGIDEILKNAVKVYASSDK